MHDEADEVTFIDIDEEMMEYERKENRFNWWEMPLLFLLSVIVAYVLGGGIRGVGLVVIWAIAILILRFESTGKAIVAFITILATFIVTFLYIIIFYQVL